MQEDASFDSSDDDELFDDIFGGGIAKKSGKKEEESDDSDDATGDEEGDQDKGEEVKSPPGCKAFVEAIIRDFEEMEEPFDSLQLY